MRNDAPQGKRERIRSYVLRQGRLTEGQKLALTRSLPRFGLDAGIPLKLDVVFAGMANEPLVLEVGFGDGRSLVAMAQAHPQHRFIGIEVHKPGVGAILQHIEAEGVENVRVYLEDAHEVLQHAIPSNVVDRFQLYFPDPWPKKRHHKRRFVREELMQLVRDRLRPGGVFHMATDWEPYAKEALTFLNAFDGLDNVAEDEGFVPRPTWRPLTKFEQRGLKLGHGVWDLLFVKRVASP
ncbi:MAG: tRNA (guanosine(46)-N7)-methyltransferase TrmB [Gammaproteobacteria bacterium]